jgi:hypothetical protein
MARNHGRKIKKNQKDRANSEDRTWGPYDIVAVGCGKPSLKKRYGVKGGCIEGEGIF